MPASVRCFAVPPVERISTPFARRALASSMIPLLSDTERIARSIRILNDAGGPHGTCRAHVAAGLFPDVVVDVHEIADGVRVADGRDTEGRRTIVEVARRVA